MNSRQSFIYVIYDKFTGEIHGRFFTEDECVSKFNEFYDGFVNIDWMGINIEYECKRRLGIE